jgi:addiction module RelE/StbE family toxin
MLRPRATRAFKRDWKRAGRRGKHLATLQTVMRHLTNEERLEAPFRDHKLAGDWQGFRECHIRAGLALDLPCRRRRDHLRSNRRPRGPVRRVAARRGIGHTSPWLVCRLVCRLRATSKPTSAVPQLGTSRGLSTSFNELTTWCLTFRLGQGALQACAFSPSAQIMLVCTFVCTVGYTKGAKTRKGSLHPWRTTMHTHTYLAKHSRSRRRLQTRCSPN